MFMNDVNKQEEIRTIATQELKSLGIKYRYKKHRQHAQEPKSRKTFKIPLHLLPSRTVTLESGQQLAIPKIIQNLCSFILTHVETEGLFRKGGSKSRQNEIKLSLDAGCCLGDEHHEIDVASILKTFFRDLPDSLIPLPYHELFLKCVLLEETRQLNAVLTASLLLPIEHLNTLSYFMQFLKCVSSHHAHNKMTAFNLAVIFGPTLLPPDEKLVHNATLRLSKTTDLFLLLIDNCQRIGALSERIISQIRLDSKDHKADLVGGVDLDGRVEGDEGGNRKKKKRRSGSLTRMFNGLKKIVGGKETSHVTPDLLMTPVLTRSSKKRKADNSGLSQKKRREIVTSLPQATALGTPLLIAKTPISNHPNVKKTPDSTRNNNTEQLPCTKEKKTQWYSRNKLPKPISEDLSTKTSKLLPERRWSAVNQVAAFKRSKNRLSMATNVNKTSNEQTETIATVQNTEINNDYNIENNDYVRISKNEYEDIKNRVSEIEKRISIELESTKASVTDVQTAYEQTLDEADVLSPTIDQLAREFSRELKIRRSADAKIIRSPSARKIGSLRRKSRERQTANKLTRNQSWHITPNLNNNAIVVNTSDPVIVPIVTRSSSLRAKFNNKSNGSLLSDKWTSAEGFFYSSATPQRSMETCRASIAKLRMRNAGMVLAKARLFDTLIDTSDSLNIHQRASTDLSTNSHHQTKQHDNKIPSANTVRVSSLKIGAERDRTSVHRARAFTKEAEPQQRLSKRVIVSPGKRCRVTTQVAFQRSPGGSGGGGRALHKRRLELLKENVRNGVADRKQTMALTVDANGVTESPKTPRNMPRIKRALNTRSPKRIHRTPVKNDYIKTPLKVLNTPILTSQL